MSKISLSLSVCMESFKLVIVVHAFLCLDMGLCSILVAYNVDNVFVGLGDTSGFSEGPV